MATLNCFEPKNANLAPWSVPKIGQYCFGHLGKQLLVKATHFQPTTLMKPFEATPAQNLLVLTASSRSPHYESLFNSIVEILEDSLVRTAHIEPDEWRDLFHSVVMLEIRAFKKRNIILHPRQLQGYLLLQDKVYCLHRESHPCFIYRRGQLLVLEPGPFEYIPLQPGDLWLTLAYPEAMQSIMAEKQLETIYHRFQNHDKAPHKKEAQGIKDLLPSDIVGLFWEPRQKSASVSEPDEEKGIWSWAIWISEVIFMISLMVFILTHTFR